MPFSLRRLSLVGFALVLVAAIIYAFLPSPIPIDLASISRGTLRVSVAEDGKTRIKERYIVSAPLQGRLLRIELDAGDTIEAGKTLLSVIEPTDPDLLDPRTRAQAEARVNASKATLKQSGTNLELTLASMEFSESELGRVRELYEKNTTSKRDFEEAAMLFRTKSEEFKSARFAEEIARFELQQAEAALLRTLPPSNGSDEDQNFEIRSPISGRVLRIFQESATVVTPGSQLLELGDPLDLEIEIDVLSSDAVRITPGAKVLLEQWGGERPLEGIVRLVEPSAFTKISALGVEEQRVNVIVDFSDPPESRKTLGDAYRVEAQIVVWEGTDVLKVPTSALFRNEGDWAVFVVLNDLAELRTVKIDHRNGLEAEVLEGLDENDRVIVHPSDRISHGVAVVSR